MYKRNNELFAALTYLSIYKNAALKWVSDTLTVTKKTYFSLILSLKFTIVVRYFNF